MRLSKKRRRSRGAWQEKAVALEASLVAAKTAHEVTEVAFADLKSTTTLAQEKILESCKALKTANARIADLETRERELVESKQRAEEALKGGEEHNEAIAKELETREEKIQELTSELEVAGQKAEKAEAEVAAADQRLIDVREAKVEQEQAHKKTRDSLAELQGEAELGKQRLTEAHGGCYRCGYQVRVVDLGARSGSGVSGSGRRRRF